MRAQERIDETVPAEAAESGVDTGAEVEAEAEAGIGDCYLERIAELEAALTAAEAERSTRERELRCLGLLADAGLPSGLADAVMAAEDMAGAVALIRGAVAAVVEDELSRRCRSDTPAKGSRAPMTRAELMSLPVAEIQRRRDMGAGFHSLVE